MSLGSAPPLPWLHLLNLWNGRISLYLTNGAFDFVLQPVAQQLVFTGAAPDPRVTVAWVWIPALLSSSMEQIP